MKVLFAGTPQFAAQYLNGLLSHNVDVVCTITQPDKPGKRGRKPLPSPVKQVATKHNLKIIQPERLSQEDIEPFHADLLLVVAYGQILNSDVLRTPKFGCINVHTSLLPRWRGAAPVQRAILAGDSHTGVCIMQMDEGLDTGDILAQQSTPISPHDTAESLREKLSLLGIETLIEVIHQVSAGTQSAKPQPHQGITYAHKITKKEACCLWRVSSGDIDRSIRAFNPDPICYSFIGDLRIRIYQASIHKTEGLQGEPGEILATSKRGILVACGTGSIMLERIQLPVGKGSILTGSDIINSRSGLFTAGKQFH